MEDVFAGLTEQGRQLVADMRATQVHVQEEERQADAERDRQALARLRAALGIGPEEEALWQALAPEYSVRNGYVLWAYGVKGQVFENLSCWMGDAIPGKVSRQSLALFIVCAQDIRAQVKALVIQHLNEEHDHLNTYGAEQKRAQVARGLWDDPDVQEARLNFLYRTRPQDITTDPDFWWYEVWLTEAARLPMGVERGEVLTLRGRARAWHSLQWRLTMAEGDDVLTADKICTWRREARTFGEDAPRRWFEILDSLAETLAQQQAEQEWRAERAQLEAAAFFPFHYYTVGYGYLTEDESGIVAETDTIPTLHMPDADGWIVDARNGCRVQVRAITTITEVTVTAPVQVPTWPSCWRGEGYGRYQAPPAGAERL